MTLSNEGELRRHREAANRLRVDISKASSKVAAKRKKAADAQGAAARSKSASTIRMKTSEAERSTKEANDAEKARANLETKLADTEVRITKLLEKVEKERATAQSKALADLRRNSQQSAAKFAPGRLGDALKDQRLTDPQPSVASRNSLVTDVFLSHASEDKDEIARPLRDALERRGVTVWFDELQIKVGQSIRQEIESGIAGCRFGVVIISPHFFAKQWTQAELDGLFGKKMESGQDLVLPIWHHVSKDEVQRHSPLLAGVMALNTAVATVDEIADSLAEVVRA
ncbi:toll/interleukin-1 receptor domain-containing protein [Phycicoccus jejuensis]|uniref:toll/interleukin-1 receptor domain-containing protein n=1 Tax=Phycicoccus jejuensis TaxID=367299 RepID=UPI00384E9A21